MKTARWTTLGVWAIFFLLLIFGVIWGVWQINAANAEKERRAEEDRIQLEIIHEQKIDKCVTFLRELALDCACHRDIKKHPTFPALQKSAREAVSYLETFPEDFEKYLKDRNESNMLSWWKEKIFGDEK